MSHKTRQSLHLQHASAYFQCVALQTMLAVMMINN